MKKQKMISEEEREEVRGLVKEKNERSLASVVPWYVLWLMNEVLNVQDAVIQITPSDICELFQDGGMICGFDNSVDATQQGRMSQLMEQVKDNLNGLMPLENCLVFFFFPKESPVMMDEMESVNALIGSLDCPVKWGMAIEKNEKCSTLRVITLLQSKNLCFQK